MTEPTPTSRPSAAELQDALQAALSWWDDMGVDVPEIAPPKPVTRRRKAAPKPAVSPKPAVRAAAAHEDIDRAALAQTLAKAAPTLEALKDAISKFDAGLLSDHAKTAVFARGNPAAKIKMRMHCSNIKKLTSYEAELSSVAKWCVFFREDAQLSRLVA